MADPREITLAERRGSRHRPPRKRRPEGPQPRDVGSTRIRGNRHYGRVIVQLSARARVIVCRNDIQWIYQRRDGKKAGAPRWVGRSYLRTRKQLIAVLRALKEPLAPSALAMLEALPENFAPRPVSA